MARFGKYILIFGLIMTLGALVGAFYFMFNHEGQIAKTLFMIVPIGFILVFFGLSTIVIFSPRSDNK